MVQRFALVALRFSRFVWVVFRCSKCRKPKDSLRDFCPYCGGAYDDATWQW